MLISLWKKMEKCGKKWKIISTFASIPCLIIIGFIFGRDSRSREVYRLAKEADDLEEKLNYEKEQ